MGVLDGLFLYLAVTALYGNQMFERITLFFHRAVSLSPQPLHQEGSSALRPHFYLVADWKAGRALRVRLHPHPLHEDDLPCRHPTLPPCEAPPHPNGHPKEVPRCPRRRGLNKTRKECTDKIFHKLNLGAQETNSRDHSIFFYIV